MSIKNFLFPFSKKESNLQNFWLHRLFTVIFFILLILTPILVFIKINGYEIKNRTDCLSFTKPTGDESYYMQNSFRAITEQRLKLENHKSSYGIDFYNAERDRLQEEWNNLEKEIIERINSCFTLNVVHTKSNLGLALLFAALEWYLLQIIYYKVLLYIVIGNKK